MSKIRRTLKRTTLPVLIVLCLAALTASYAYADGALRPLATQIIGDPDAAVTGKLAVGTATPGNKALTVVGVIDFLGAGTVHNYFTQGGGNNMQINTNVDEANTVVDATKSQWKLVLGSSLDWFSIRRSPPGGTYNEDALFFIEGPTGNVGIATVDTGNGGAIPFTPAARLHVETASGDAIHGVAAATTGSTYGVFGQSDSTGFAVGVYGLAPSTAGGGLVKIGVSGEASSTAGIGVLGYGTATTGSATGVRGETNSPSGYGVYGYTWAATGTAVYGGASGTAGQDYGVYGSSVSTGGTGVFGTATATSGWTEGVYGRSTSTTGIGVYGETITTSGGFGVLGYATATTGSATGVRGETNSPSGYGVYGYTWATTGTGVYGGSAYPTTGYAGYFNGNLGASGTKSAIVETQDHGWRHLYAVESPRNWFEDFGRATLTAGEAVVPIEPVFAQTVNLGGDYHVFLTPLGSACLLYVVDMSPTSFTVRADEGAACEISFDYRIIAPRLDYEGLRLEPAEDPEAVAAAALAAARTE